MALIKPETFRRRQLGIFVEGDEGAFLTGKRVGFKLGQTSG